MLQAQSQNLNYRLQHDIQNPGRLAHQLPRHCVLSCVNPGLSFTRLLLLKHGCYLSSGGPFSLSLGLQTHACWAAALILRTMSSSKMLAGTYRD